MEGITSFITSSSSSSSFLRSSSSSGDASTLSLSSNIPFILPMRLSTPTFTLIRPKFTMILSFTSNNIKVGASIEVDGAPWNVLEFLHVKPGKELRL